MLARTVRSKNDKPVCLCRKVVLEALMVLVMRIGVMGTSQFDTLFTRYCLEIDSIFFFC